MRTGFLSIYLENWVCHWVHIQKVSLGIRFNYPRWSWVNWPCHLYCVGLYSLSDYDESCVAIKVVIRQSKMFVRCDWLAFISNILSLPVNPSFKLCLGFSNILQVAVYSIKYTILLLWQSYSWKILNILPVELLLKVVVSGSCLQHFLEMFSVQSLHRFYMQCFFFRTTFCNNIPYQVKLCRAQVTNFLIRDKNFVQQIVLLDENFAQQSFAQQNNHNLSKWLVSLLNTLVLQLKTLYFYWEKFSVWWKRRNLHLVTKISPN